MSIHLGFKVAAAHHLFLQEMMSGPKKTLRLDNKRVEQITTFVCNPGGGVVGVTVDELAEWNFKLLV